MFACLYICVYIYTFIHIYIYMYIYIHVYIYICTYYIHIRIYIYIQIYLNKHNKDVGPPILGSSSLVRLNHFDNQHAKSPKSARFQPGFNQVLSVSLVDC